MRAANEGTNGADLELEMKNQSSPPSPLVVGLRQQWPPKGREEWGTGRARQAAGREGAGGDSDAAPHNVVRGEIVVFLLTKRCYDFTPKKTSTK